MAPVADSFSNRRTISFSIFIHELQQCVTFNTYDAVVSI